MLESEDIDGDLEEVNSASGDNTGDEEVAATEKSEEEKQKPKKKSIIVWQCLNPECTVTSKRVLRYLYLLLTASLSAVFRSQKGTKPLHTSGSCPGDGSYYY